MKAKIIGYLSEVVIIGVGAVVTKVANDWFWIGFVLIGVGLLGIVTTAFWGRLGQVIPVIRFERRRNARRVEDLIIRQIIRINTSSLVSGISESVDVGVLFPAFISNQLLLAKVRGYLTIDGNPTDEQEFRPFTLFISSPNENQLRVALTPQVAEKVKVRARNHIETEISLHLTGWDTRNNQYDLSTRGWTTKL